MATNRSAASGTRTKKSLLKQSFKDANRKIVAQKWEQLEDDDDDEEDEDEEMTDQPVREQAHPKKPLRTCVMGECLRQNLSLTKMGRIHRISQ